MSPLTADQCDVECLHPDVVRPILGATVPPSEALRVADFFATLADPTRLRILNALSLTDELCVCDLALVLGRSVSALSHQLRLLRDRGVVSRRKVGRVVYYRLADAHIRGLVEEAIGHVGEDAPSGDVPRVEPMVAGA